MPNIHQEIAFKASPSRVYDVLVDSKRFAEVTGAPASGESTEGASFSVFGGHIVGRHVVSAVQCGMGAAGKKKGLRGSWPGSDKDTVMFPCFPDDIHQIN